MFTVLGGAFLTFIVAKRRERVDKLFFRVTTPLAKFIVELTLGCGKSRIYDTLRGK